MKVLMVGEGASELDGALETLVRRLSSTELDIDQDKVSQTGIHVHHGKGSGYFKRAVRWMMEAEKRGYDALVLVIDQDDQKERNEQIAQAQTYVKTTIRRALGVAVRTFDAWMLADEMALTTVLAYTINRQPDPEAIHHPKKTFGSLLEPMGNPRRVAEIYSDIAQAVDINLLEARCPNGFGSFAQRVRAL